MGEIGRNFSSQQNGIPSGLNRIKTRDGSSSSSSFSKNKDKNKKNTDRLNYVGVEDSASTVSGNNNNNNNGVPRPPPPLNNNNKKMEKDVVGDANKEEPRKGKKITHWFTSYLTKASNQAFNNTVTPSMEVSNSEVKVFDKERSWGAKHSPGKEPLPESLGSRKVPIGLKSFSHELGPKGGIRPAYPRAHSYNDLKELLGSLRSRFDAAKVVVNAELINFAADVVEILKSKGFSSPEGERAAEDLLTLAQQCTEMSPTEFRAKCEGIVHDLAEKRRQCQAGLLKHLFTHMLFILTRCTRLLQFEKDSEPIDEDSLHKFKQCLESIPSIEMNWIPKPGSSDLGSNDCLSERDIAKHHLPGLNTAFSLPEKIICKPEEPQNKSNRTSRSDPSVLAQKPVSQNARVDTQSTETRISESELRSFSAPTRRVSSSSQEDTLQYHQGDGALPTKLLRKSSYGSLQERDRIVDGSDSVICRICEEPVPTNHLESHSYICAYADKCDLNSLDIDERLSKLAEILEQIVESSTPTYNISYDSPEILRIQMSHSMIGSECQSPKIIEWHNKGVEGMFEDLHEMDTACLDDSHIASSNSLKGHLGIKLGQYGAPSSSGSMTSVSSTNTPRTSHFDLFWLEYNNSSEPEDVQQMTDLADIANCIASTDITKEGASYYLLECMHDLEDILQYSKLKALVIDTFGSRIENLLREKYTLACGSMYNRSPKDVTKLKEGIGHMVDSTSQGSAVSTPSHAAHKERTSIDDFEIIKPISRGAYGKVFLARKRTTGDLFAIKVLKKLDMIRKNDIERILAERNILITVRNPFVVRFYYSFTCRENLYLVMEYLNGGDMYSLLRKIGCLEEDVARTYIAELVLALEYLHSLGIVHRDLKPDNILIAHDGHTKLTDFGLSKIGLINSTVELSGSRTNDDSTLLNADDMHASFESTSQREEGTQRSAVGTPDYLAPEILLGTQHGYAADWWSVGIILFEFITGIPPFNAERSEIIFANILNGKVPWPDVPSEMSYEARDLINRFLIHEPDQRLGVNGASEVKAHPFFKGVNWDTLALKKAAFVPSPDTDDDTSYFTSRYSQVSDGIPEDQNCSDSGSESTSNSCSNSGLEMDECGELADFGSSPLDLSLMNFSFKNLSQLASINYDLLMQSGKDSSKCPSPSRSTES